jgi:hypothetical protein
MYVYIRVKVNRLKFIAVPQTFAQTFAVENFCGYVENFLHLLKNLMFVV